MIKLLFQTFFGLFMVVLITPDACGASFHASLSGAIQFSVAEEFRPGVIFTFSPEQQPDCVFSTRGLAEATCEQSITSFDESTTTYHFATGPVSGSNVGQRSAASASSYSRGRLTIANINLVPIILALRFDVNPEQIVGNATGIQFAKTEISLQVRPPWTTYAYESSAATYVNGGVPTPFPATPELQFLLPAAVDVNGALVPGEVWTSLESYVRAVAAVPEPSTALLFGAGSALLWLCSRRRRA